MKNKFEIILLVNIFFASLLIFVFPEFVNAARLIAIGLAVVLIELPLCFMILSNKKEDGDDE